MVHRIECSLAIYKRSGYQLAIIQKLNYTIKKEDENHERNT